MSDTYVLIWTTDKESGWNNLKRLTISNDENDIRNQMEKWINERKILSKFENFGEEIPSSVLKFTKEDEATTLEVDMLLIERWTDKYNHIDIFIKYENDLRSIKKII